MSTAPEGRRLLRIEAKNAETPIENKPSWIRTTAKTGPEYKAMKERVSGASLHTVCQEANCPNMYECWEDREATFLIGGDQCTRRCDFCNIATGKPDALDRDEPRRVAESVREMGLRYATVTGVARDDLPDGASWLYAETCRQIHELNPGTGVELLVDDFRGDGEAAEAVFEARPEVFAHNIETVPRIFKQIRPAFRYERSLEMISRARKAGLVTKSNLILGMGEERDEVLGAMRDLVDAGCDILTITQYLRPSPMHHPIDRWVKPSSWPRPPARSDSTASWPARWSARPTAPAACTPARSPPAARSCPPTSTRFPTPRMRRPTRRPAPCSPATARRPTPRSPRSAKAPAATSTRSPQRKPAGKGRVHACPGQWPKVVDYGEQG